MSEMRAGPTEAWILAGTLDGIPAHPSLDEDVCGMPYVLRLAADLAHAGATEIHVVWLGDGTAPAIDDVSGIAGDARLRGARVTADSSAPGGDPDQPVLLVRADRIYHRDLPKLCVKAWREHDDARLARVADLDAVVVVARADAERICGAAAEAGGIAAAVAAIAPASRETSQYPRSEPAVEVDPPYLGFSVAAADHRGLRRAEKQLVWSLRKQWQGIAAYWINRHLSLPVTRAIMRTSILPNHVTVFCFLLAVAGGVVIGQGGYLAGLVGMVLVNLGSILDGVDGELARLKYRFSDIGAWLDTLADDFGNVAYISGIAFNLHDAGMTWTTPLAITALVCFALTQSTQYFLITKVYKSGDLAAIPWAFQSSEFLTTKGLGLWGWLKQTLPKTLKRDFALTMFVVFAAIGRLEWILVVFSAGAIVFFVVFAVQLLRNLDSIRSAARS